jgi:TIR domain
MIEYPTLSKLRAFQNRAAADSAATIRKAERRSVVGATFLSHSSKDKEYLPGVIQLLEEHGARVYIDKKDDTLPPYTSRETAEALRSRIIECDKFILFATESSKGSRWMPWELGVSDGLKPKSEIAVFPGVESVNDKDWAEREFLGIYDRVVWGDIKGRPNRVWMVWNRERNSACELSAWLQR